MNYQADFIHESYLPAEKDLDAYRVIFLTDACIGADASQKLSSWIERGGTLIAITSAGECDELARPGGKLAKALGIQAIDHKLGPAQKVTFSAGPTLSIGAGAIALASMDGAQVLGKFEDGSPALWSKNIGKGRLLFFSFMPGNAFHLGSTFTRDGLMGTQDIVLDAMRPLVAAAGAPLCETNQPLVSARVIESAAGSVVFLINRSNAKIDHVKVTLRKTSTISAESLQNGDAHAMKNSEGALTWDLPVDLWDVVKVR